MEDLGNSPETPYRVNQNGVADKVAKEKHVTE